MQSSILREVVTVAWAAVGYGLASGNGPFVGDLRFARLDNAGSAPRADYAPTIPQQTFIVYQLMVIITSALIPGVFAERMKFSGILSASNDATSPWRGKEGYIFESSASGRVSLRLG